MILLFARLAWVSSVGACVPTAALLAGCSNGGGAPEKVATSSTSTAVHESLASSTASLTSASARSSATRPMSTSAASVGSSTASSGSSSRELICCAGYSILPATITVESAATHSPITDAILRVAAGPGASDAGVGSGGADGVYSFAGGDGVTANGATFPIQVSAPSFEPEIVAVAVGAQNLCGPPACGYGAPSVLTVLLVPLADAGADGGGDGGSGSSSGVGASSRSASGSVSATRAPADGG
jgi:hypothetical protein